MSKVEVREVGKYQVLYRDTKTGIAWIEDGNPGLGHSCHPNIDKSGSVTRMRNLGYWGQTDRVVESHGWKCNIDKYVIDPEDPLDAIVARECMCEACVERRGEAQKKEKEAEAKPSPYLFLCRSYSGCFYIKTDAPLRDMFPCGVNTGWMRECLPAYENEVETFLSEQEYERLKAYEHFLIKGRMTEEDLGKKEAEIRSDLENNIIPKLRSQEAQEFYAEIMEQEKEALKRIFSFTDKQIEHILEKYPTAYRGREIVKAVFSDAEELGLQRIGEYIRRIGEEDNPLIARYFDFERYGTDLAKDSSHFCTLDDGRIVEFR